MKPCSGPHPHLGRGRGHVVYVHSFGSHRSGTVIHYGGRGHLQPAEKGALADPHACLNKAASATDRMSPGGTNHSSPRGKRISGLLLGAASRMSAKGAGRHGSLSLREGGKAKGARIRKGAKGSKADIQPPSSPNNSRSSTNVAVYPTACSSQKQIGDYQKTQGDAFEFPLEDAGNVILQQKNKFAVWNDVSKVISKMVEENEHFRKRLMSCSQRSNEEEAIFGWV